MNIRTLAFLAIASCAALWIADSAPAQDNTVTITNFKFEPKTLTVPAGATVTWDNKEGAHTVTADKGEFKSPNLRAGEKFSFTFTKPGAYAYHCAFHGSSGGGNMAGSIIVAPPKKR